MTELERPYHYSEPIRAATEEEIDCLPSPMLEEISAGLYRVTPETIRLVRATLEERRVRPSEHGDLS